MKNRSLPDVKEFLHLLETDEASALVAFRNLYDLFAPKILRAATNFLRNEVMAEDLVQDVFTTIWQKRMQLQHVENIELYLYGMVKNQAAKAITQKLRFDSARLEFTERINLAEEEDTRIHYEAKLHKMVDELPEQRKTIFRLAKMEGLSYEAIAQKMNISVHTVNHNITKALKFMEAQKQDIISLLIVTTSLILG